MADNNKDRAIELLSVFDKEWGSSSDSNFRSMYQEVADVMFPRENQITTTRSAGQIIGRDIIDPTGQIASIDMAAGLSINLFPPGDKFYNILMADRELNEVPAVKQALGRITEISHERRANSNFMLQANETLRSLGTLGTGCMFSEWKVGVGLNYTDYDIGKYTFFENDQGLVDTMMLQFIYTAKQAFQKWGKEAGETVLKKMEDAKTRSDEFKFVWIVQPRDLEKQIAGTNMEMPFESLYISRTDTDIVEENGFPEFPFQVPRWTKSSGEKWGRGVGTVAVGLVNALQRENSALVNCAELHNNPPKEVLDIFDGEIMVSPGDLNFVPQLGTIKSVEQQSLGNFAITEKVIEMHQAIVQKIFYGPAFNQLEQLKGDRRNELEIRSRLAEGLRKLVSPVGRIQSEWLTGLVVRDINLLQRNNQFGDLPQEMDKKPFKVEYVGRLALELQAAQSIGWLRWVEEGIEIEQSVPGTLDNVNIDGGYRRRGITLGVSIEDITEEGEVLAKRDQRKADLEAQQAKELAAGMAEAYGKTTKAPESGSAAEAVINS